MTGDQTTIRAVREIMAATGLTYTEVAVAAGVSASTVRHVLAVEALPERSHPRLQLARFVDRNRDVTRRDQVKFV
jgi:hypothetical protein